MTPIDANWRRFGVFIVNFEYVAAGWDVNLLVLGVD